MLTEFDCSNMSSVVSPLDFSTKLLPGEGIHVPYPSIYRTLVGKLNFLTNTRPDLSFVVQHLSQFMSDPREPHWKAVIHVLRYLKSDTDQGLFFSNSSNYKVEAYYDTDWAACSHTRRSVSGFVVFLGDNLISWKSKKQHTISLSSADAEYRSLRCVTVELAWLSHLFAEFDIPEINPIPVKCDNMVAIYIAKNPVYHERTNGVMLFP